MRWERRKREKENIGIKSNVTDRVSIFSIVGPFAIVCTKPMELIRRVIIFTSQDKLAILIKCCCILKKKRMVISQFMK